jgi:hypothetical protein
MQQMRVLWRNDIACLPHGEAEKGEANMIQHCGRAVFVAGAAREVVDFTKLAELAEKEDELTWKHWPAELKIVSFDYRPAVNHQTI